MILLIILCPILGIVGFCMVVNILMFIYRFVMFSTFPANSRKFPQISRNDIFKIPYVSIWFYQETRIFSRNSRKSRKFLRVIWVAKVVPKSGSVLGLDWNLTTTTPKIFQCCEASGLCLNFLLRVVLREHWISL